MRIGRQAAPACSDPDEAYFPPDSVTRRVNGDFPSMLVGGLGALLLQMLHPLAMAGVADHSSYREDPIGRLQRTASFLGTTTFRGRTEVAAAIGRVRAIHDRVIGISPDGTRYSANDPELLTWVHAAESHCFLAASLAYGANRLTPFDQDRYLDEMSRVALDLGAVEVPRTTRELDTYFETMQPKLALTPAAVAARNFVIVGPSRRPHEMATYGLLLAAAQSVLPGWARRRLHLVPIPMIDAMGVRPAARVLAATLRWVVTPTAR